MRWQLFYVLIIAFSITIAEFSEAAFVSLPSFTRQLTFVLSTEASFDDSGRNSRQVDLISPERSRKQKRNKYQDFSKISDQDPLDLLISESKRKNDEMNSEVASPSRKNIKAREALATSSVVYPDVKGIDPYDPQTFGYTFIGTIVGAHGVHGWLKVQCSTDFPHDRLCTPGIRHLKAANKRAPRPIFLLSGKHRHGDEYLVQCEDVHSRECATKLRGAQLYIRDDQTLHNLGSDDYSVSELVGSEVFLTNEGPIAGTKFVGIVNGVVFSEDICSLPGLGHDYLEIILPRGIGGTKSFRDEMVLIPFVPSLVPEVDIPCRKIYIDPPAGLLDLTYVREDKARIKGFLPPSNVQ